MPERALLFRRYRRERKFMGIYTRELVMEENRYNDFCPEIRDFFMLSAWIGWNFRRTVFFLNCYIDQHILYTQAKYITYRFYSNIYYIKQDLEYTKIARKAISIIYQKQTINRECFHHPPYMTLSKTFIIAAITPKNNVYTHIQTNTYIIYLPNPAKNPP